MTKIDSFFLEMESLFLKGDTNEFKELKEDLLEHISIQLNEGLDEDEILARLGNPQDIAADFYEEKRLHTAFNSESDVVPLEKVKEVYFEKRREKRYQTFDKIIGILKATGQVLFFILSIYSGIYLVFELIIEHHFALLPFLILAISVTSIFLYRCTKIGSFKNGNTKKYVFILSLLIWITVVNFDNKDFLYQGAEVSDKLSFEGNQIDEIIIKSDFEVNLTVIPNPNSSELILYVKGHGKKNLEKHLEISKKANSKRLELNLDMKNVFDLFTDIKNLQVTAAIPESFKSKNIKLNFKEADIQMQDVTLKNITLKLKEGLLSTKRLSSSSIDIDSKHAGIVMDNFESRLHLKTETGKVILKNGVGNVNLKTLSGLSNFIKLAADNVSLDTNDGKVVITDTKIKNLDIVSNNETVILENQTGKTHLSLREGKLIATNNNEKLYVTSYDASIIILQNGPLLGTIKNELGLVKWVQSPLEPINFELSSADGEIVDDRSESEKQPNQGDFKITTEFGDINIYDQVILDELIP